MTFVINGCPDGHEHTTLCCNADTMKSSPKNCQTMVKITMPFCKHEISVRCGQRKVVKCPVRCGMPLTGSCGHICKGKCGACIARTNKKFKIDLHGIAQSNPQKAQEWKSKMEHVPCLEKCGKSLMCGHFCQSPCHISGDIHLEVSLPNKYVTLLCIHYKLHVCFLMSSAYVDIHKQN